MRDSTAFRCSGGDDGVGCFSTRLMWRGGGKGELYLVSSSSLSRSVLMKQYAKKDVQSQSLCATPPRSMCNSVYGLSIGRGSFVFKRSSWTRVKQTVWLNTPGKNNGGFVLEVGYGEVQMLESKHANKYKDDGPLQVVMNNAEVYYRGLSVPDYTLSSWEIDDVHSEDDDPDRQLSPPQDATLFAVEMVPPLLFLHERVDKRQERSDEDATKTVTVTVYAVQGTKTVTIPNFATVVSTAVVSVTSAIGSPNRTERPLPTPTNEDESIGFSGIFFR